MPIRKLMIPLLRLLAVSLLSLPLMSLAAEPAKAAAKPPATEAATPSADTAPPAPQLPPQRAETRRSKALERQLQAVDKETERLWLGSSDDPFLGLYRADHSGNRFASALILHDNLQHPDWPGLVHHLRTGLAAHGWNTLAIALPDYQTLPALPPPGATSDGAATPAQAPLPDLDSPLLDVEYSQEQVPEILGSRVKAAIDTLKQKNSGPVVVIALGLAAGMATKKAQTMLIQDIAGLVIIDPVQPDGSDFNTDLDAADLRIPILDIAPEFFPRTDPAPRRHSASRTRQRLFQQRLISGARPDFRGQESVVLKAVRGWGEQHFRSRARP